MFNKILSNLQFNESYRAKLRQFISRERKESLIRRWGLIFICLALATQFLAFVDPSKTTAAASDNDLIPGGVGSQQQLVNDCNSDYHYIATIYGYYGVTCSDIADTGSVVSLVSTFTDNGQVLYSVGHTRENFPGEVPVNIYGGELYWRPLHDWDTGAYSTYTALRVKADGGKAFWILFTCGNLVSVGFPTQYFPPTPPATAPAKSPTVQPPAPVQAPPQAPAPCPYNSFLTIDSSSCKPCPDSQSINDVLSCLTYSKAASNLTQGIADANNTTANAGDIIQYTLTVNNTGQSVATDVIVQDKLDQVLDYATPQNVNGGSLGMDDLLTWPAVSIPANSSIQKQFSVQVDNPIPSTPPPAGAPVDTLTNTYQNTITIKVSPPATLTAVQTASSLPNTGPGSNIAIAFVIAVVAGYFYSRSRLLAKEARIADIVVEGEAG